MQLKKKSYRPDIDGLRAVAVSAVIANHIDTRFLPSGFLGVDIFFAISGYVITASLLSRQHTNFKAMLLSFYGRRIKRLLPALIACVLISSLVFCFLSPTPAASLWAGIWSMFGFSNIYFYLQQTDYFSISSELTLFLHTWSLGVEEQFYLLFPLIFWLSLQRQRLTRALLAGLAASLIAVMAASKILAASALAFLPEAMRSLGVAPYLALLVVLVLLPLIVASRPAPVWKAKFGQLFISIAILTSLSCVLFLVFSHAQSAAAFFLTSHRFWELGAGCLLALWMRQSEEIAARAPQPPATRYRSALSLACLLAMISGFFVGAEWKIISTPLMIVLTLLLIGTTTADRPASRRVNQVLCAPALRFIGLISYSLYLWHWPLLVLTRWTVGLHVWSVALLLPLILLVAMASYYGLEAPLRRARWAATEQSTLSRGLVAQLAASGCVVALLHQPGNPLYSGSGSKQAADLGSLAVANSTVSVSNCSRSSGESLHACRIQAQRDKPSLVLLGDSHAGHLYPSIGLILARTGMGLATHNTAGNQHQPFPTLVFASSNAHLRSMKARAAEINAFYSAIQPTIKAGDLLILSSDLRRYFKAADPDSDPTFQRWLAQTRRLAIALQARRASVVVVAPLPLFPSGGGPNCERQWFRPELPETCFSSLGEAEARASSQPLLRSLRRLASEQANLFIYDPLPLFCDPAAKLCRNGHGDVIYFLDQDHLAPSSAQLVAADLLAFLKRQGLLPPSSPVATHRGSPSGT